MTRARVCDKCRWPLHNGHGFISPDGKSVACGRCPKPLGAKRVKGKRR